MKARNYSISNRYKYEQNLLQPGEVFNKNFTWDSSNARYVYELYLDGIVTRITGSLTNHKWDNQYGSRTCYVYAVLNDGTEHMLASAASNGSKKVVDFDVTFNSNCGLAYILTVCNTAANSSVTQGVKTVIDNVYYNLPVKTTSSTYDFIESEQNYDVRAGYLALN